MTDLHHHDFSGQTPKDVVVYFALATTFCKKYITWYPPQRAGYLLVLLADDTPRVSAEILI
jgi:hypothetical protein